MTMDEPMMHSLFLRKAAVPALLAVAGLQAQAPLQVRDAAALQLALDKLQVVGTVLYVAAHPDDENTAALAYFSQGRMVRTAYLSMTRGGGGQNLIGSEQGDGLSVLRTQELLAARRLDGAEQFFTRAVDFGFSKTPAETLGIWGHEPALADVVWTIRKLRPDVILTRFSPTAGGTHGHHTASAMLALEAFAAAADPARFPEQLRLVEPWQAKRILWNSFRPQAERDAQAPGAFVTVDVGRYDPLLGKAYTELAAASRSMHRSQGFGALAARGAKLEYFDLLAGSPLKDDLLEGVDLTWRRVPGGAAVGELLARARAAYRPERPSDALPLLLQAKAALDRLEEDAWVEVKREELTEAIRCAAGVWAEAIAERQATAAGEPLAVAATVLVRGGVPVTLEGIDLVEAREAKRALPMNQPVTERFTVTLPPGTPTTQPYWLKEPRLPGREAQAPSAYAGLPERPALLTATFRFAAAGVPFELPIPVRYRFRDPVLGERYHPVAIVPPVLVNLPEAVHIFGDGAVREVALVVAAGKDKAAGTLRLQVPPGWSVEPPELPFALARAGDEARLSVRLRPPQDAQSGTLKVVVAMDGVTFPAHGLVRLDYPHLPLQTYFPPATARVVRLDLHIRGRRLGYVMGAGDDLPGVLRPLGFEVDLLSDEALAEADLGRYDAILIGIRAFNTRPRLAQLHGRILDYVAKGGTEVVQYSVDQGLVTPVLGPFPFTVSRTRVSEETAPVTFLAPDHPALNWPNRITAADFEGWVQERGLQFAGEWDARYVPILSTHDQGEPPSGGGLLVAAHGKGRFVYTGLAFFRQLPAGVPGAYRLFANLLALGQAHE
jgi:LmbE family N-acetylglucosaminyl deacetylase